VKETDEAIMLSRIENLLGEREEWVAGDVDGEDMHDAVDRIIRERDQAQLECRNMRKDAASRGIHLDNGRCVRCVVCGELAAGVCTHMGLSDINDLQAELQTMRKLANDLATMVMGQCPETWSRIRRGVSDILGVVIPGDLSYLERADADKS